MDMPMVVGLSIAGILATYLQKKGIVLSIAASKTSKNEATELVIQLKDKDFRVTPQEKTLL